MRQRRLWIGIIATGMLAMAVVSTPPAVAATAITSDFTTGVDGWRLVGDPAHPPQHRTSGGNPGGWAEAIDDVIPGEVTYWEAPHHFLGNRSEYFGGQLTFDLKQAQTDYQFDSFDVELSGGGLTLEYNHSPNPGTAWTSYTIPLSAAGWTKSGSAATTSDMQAMLAGLGDLRIRAEFSTNGNVVGLDNVVLAGPPVISVADGTVVEGDSGTTQVRFRVSLSAPSLEKVTIRWATADDTATAPTDYVATSGAFQFQPGQTSKTIVVTVNGDALYELLERVSVSLSVPTNAVLGDRQASGRIRNDDDLPSLSVGDIAVLEGGAGTATLLRFRVRLSAPAGTSTSFTYQTGAGTANAADYVAAAGTTTIPAGNDVKIVNVTVNGDGTPEPDETVPLVISAPKNATIADAEGIGTVRNDD